MAIELVTGHSGEDHVSSADTGRFNAGVCGTGKYVLATGSQFAYTIVSANQINVASGDAVNQGRHIIIPQNTYESAAIQNGTNGKTRIDVIALRYKKASSGGSTIETAELVVIKGAEVNVGSVPSAPAVVSGNIFAGAAQDDMPLYHVLITGTSITSVTKVFEVIRSLATMADMIYPVGSIYMNVSNVDPSGLFGGTWERIQGRFLLGVSSGHAAGSTGGAETVTLTASQLPAHTHEIPAHTHNVPDHVHTVPSHTHTATTASAGEHTHRVQHVKVAGSGTTRWAAGTSADNYSYSSAAAGAHTHKITVNSKDAFATTPSGSCTTGSTAGTTERTGDGAPVSIMPPFLAVYIWKRTA